MRRFWKCLEPAPAPAPALAPAPAPEEPDTCDQCFLPENTSDYTYLLNMDGEFICIRCCFKENGNWPEATKIANRDNINIELLEETDPGDHLPYANDESESIQIFCDIFKGKYDTQAQQVQHEELNGLLDTSPLKLKALLEAVSKSDTDAKAELERTGFLSMAARAETEEQTRHQLNENRITNWINDPTQRDNPQGGGYKKKRRLTKKRRKSKKKKKSKKKRKSKRR